MQHKTHETSILDMFFAKKNKVIWKKINVFLEKTIKNMFFSVSRYQCQIFSLAGLFCNWDCW